MKKTLLLASLAMFATVASAQTIVGLATSEELEAAGLSGTKTDIPGGTLILENEAGSFSLAYDDKWGSTSTYKNYRTVEIGGETIELGSGAVGDTNPGFTSYEEGVMYNGAVFQIEAKKDGYMTVFTKVNPNKQYLVFEGKSGALAYTLGVAGDGYKIHYATPAYTEGEDTGLIDFDASDASKYFITATKQSVNEAGELLWYNKEGDIVAGERPVWQVEDGTNEDGTVKYKDVKGGAVMEEIPGQHKPQFPYLIAGMEKAPGESTGFLTFSVMEGNTYYFSALGSKAACGGFVYTEENPAITYAATDALPEVVFEAIELGGTPGAVEGIEAANDANAPIYNALGVRVNADAKGLLIQNGKKFIRK